MADCMKCNAECCRYVTAIIPRPKNKEDWEEIKWYLLHKGVIVYKDLDKEWNLEVKTPCKHINLKTNMCNIHPTRPQTCRDHETHECEANDEEFAEIIFQTVEDVEKYLKKKSKKKPKKKSKK